MMRSLAGISVGVLFLGCAGDESGPSACGENALVVDVEGRAYAPAGIRSVAGQGHVTLSHPTEDEEPSHLFQIRLENGIGLEPGRIELPASSLVLFYALQPNGAAEPSTDVTVATDALPAANVPVAEAEGHVTFAQVGGEGEARCGSFDASLTWQDGDHAREARLVGSFSALVEPPSDQGRHGLGLGHGLFYR